LQSEQRSTPFRRNRLDAAAARGRCRNYRKRIL